MQETIVDDLLGRLLMALPDAIVVSDQEGRIIFANRQAEAMTGYARKELVGLHVERLVPRRLRAGHERHRAEFFGTAAARPMGTGLEITLQRRDGEQIPVDIALNHLATASGQVVVAAIRDMTDRRRAERKLREQAQLLELAHDAVLVRDLRDDSITYWNQGAVETYGYSRREATGRASHELLRTRFQTGREDVEKELRKTGQWEGMLVHSRSDDSEVIVASRQALVRDDQGRPTAVFEINRDVTAQQRAHQRVEAAHELGQAIMAGWDTDDVLRLLTRRARELADAGLGVLVSTAGDGEMAVEAADGQGAEQLLGFRSQVEGSLVDHVLRERAPLVVPDLAKDPRRLENAPVVATSGPAILVPLAVGPRVIGVLALLRPGARRPFGADDAATIQHFAATAALAIEYARAREELRQMAVIEDRERIAREIHDGVIQAIFGVAMGLQATSGRLRDPELAGRVDAAVDQLDEVIRDLRSYIFELRPSLLRRSRLGQAVRDAVTEFQAASGVAVTVGLDEGLARELEDRESELLQIVREALSNVTRHAAASTCSVALRREGERAVLEIRDDGAGFDPARRGPRGHGLRNFEERAARLGGRLQLHSRPGEGTSVRIVFPRSRPDPGAR